MFGHLSSNLNNFEKKSIVKKKEEEKMEKISIYLSYYEKKKEKIHSITEKEKEEDGQELLCLILD